MAELLYFDDNFRRIVLCVSAFMYGLTRPTVDVDIFTCIDFRDFTEVGNISRGFKFAFLMLLPLYGMVQVIFKLYIFSRIFGKRE